jgi:hypothetical protein
MSWLLYKVARAQMFRLYRSNPETQFAGEGRRS